MGLKTETLPQLLLAQAESQPDVTIFRTKYLGLWKSLGWRETAGDVAALGAALCSAGLQVGETVAIVSENRLEAVHADLAVMGARAVSLILSPTEPDEVTVGVIRNRTCRFAFVENEQQLDRLLTLKPDLPVLQKIIVLDMRGLHALDPELAVGLAAFKASAPAGVSAWHDRVHAAEGKETAACMMTAGTSGIARSVLLGHAELMRQARHGAQLLGLSDKDTRVAFLPIAHASERTVGLYQSLVSGTISHYAESPETVLGDLAEVQPTVLVSVPRFWRRLQMLVLRALAEASPVQRRLFAMAMAGADRNMSTHRASGMLAQLADRLVLSRVRERLGLSNLRVAVAAAAPAGEDLLEWFRALGIVLERGYVLTEFGLVSVGPERNMVKLESGGAVLIARADTETGETTWIASGDQARETAYGLAVLGRLSETGGGEAERAIAARVEDALRQSALVADAICEAGSSGIDCMIQPDHDGIELWALEKGLSFRTSAMLIQSEDISRLFGELAEQAARDGGSPKGIAGLHVLARKLHAGDEALTPTLALRRSQLRRALPGPAKTGPALAVTK